MTEEITILHTNDFHSHFENWPKIRRYLESQKRQLVRENQTVLTFDIGDFMDRVHPLTEATMGQANVDLLNEVGYDAVTVGNNEMLGFPHAVMDEMYDHANFKVLLANVKDRQTATTPKWASQYEIIETKAKTKLGVIAFTAPFILTFPLLGWDPQAASEALKPLLAELTPKVDCIILLSHLGLPTDRFLADNFSQLDLIIGAHTHHLLPEGEERNQSLLAAAGKYGQHVGKISLTLEAGKIIAKQATVQSTADLPALPADDDEITNAYETGKKLLQKEQIALLPTSYAKDLNAGDRLVDLGLKALELKTNTKVAMLSTGLFLNDLPAGPVNAFDLHQLLPHAVHANRVTLTGENLLRLYREVNKNRMFMRAAKIRGMGFRGDTWGEIVWDGLTQSKTGELLVNGQALDLQAKYQVGSLDHYLFIPYFPTIEIAGENELLYDTVFREDFGDYLAQKFPQL